MINTTAILKPEVHSNENYKEDFISTNDENQKIEDDSLAHSRLIEDNKDKFENQFNNTTENSQTRMIPENQKNPPLLDEDGLIIPRKLPNPVKDNMQRQDLHREILFNKKMGKNVLNQKSELQRALEKQKGNMLKKLVDEERPVAELDKVIADRSKRLQENNSKNEDDDKVLNNEFLQARMKLKSRHESH